MTDMHTVVSILCASMLLLSNGTGHVGFCILYCDTQLLCEFFEFLQIFASSSSSGFVSFLKELCAILGDGVHDVLELLKLFHHGGRLQSGEKWGEAGKRGDETDIVLS